jgi:hypothetical protein
MQSDSFFESLGSTLGQVIRAIVGALKYVLGGFGRAIGDFSAGLAHAMGMNASVFNFAILILGLLLLVAAIKALLRRSILGFIFWIILAVVVLGALIG